LAATATSFLAGRATDRIGPVAVLTAGAGASLAAYLLLATGGSGVLLLGMPFVLAGIGIGCVETAEHAGVATFARSDIRGSAFGVLAAVQSFGNLAASGVAGLLWTFFSPRIAFIYVTAWMGVAVVGFLTAGRDALNRSSSSRSKE